MKQAIAIYTNDPEWGILSTPVVSADKSTLYVVACGKRKRAVKAMRELIAPTNEVLQFFEWSRRGQHTLPLIDRTSARPTGSSYKNLHRLPVFLEEGLAAQGVTHKPLLQRGRLLVTLAV